jgi:hypothetical protein
MKQKKLFLFLLLICIGLLGYFLSKPTLSYELLLSNLPDAAGFNMTLFYSDAALSSPKGYAVSEKGVSPLKTTFKSFTEGFLPSPQHKRVLSAINGFRKDLQEPPLTYFHDYYEDTSSIIVSFTGGLEAIYILDKQDLKVKKLVFLPEDNLGNMYVSHIKLIGDTFVLLGGKVNAYEAFIYQIDALSLRVKKAVQIPTHPSAISHPHYTLDSMGNAIFINDDKLLVMPFPLDEPFYIPLPFTSQYVFSSNSQIIALSFTKDKLLYALFDQKLKLVQDGSLPLPNENVILVNGFLQENNLQLILYDPAHRVYRNYLTLYNLKTEKLLYCLALHTYKGKALLDGSPMTAFDSLKN